MQRCGEASVQTVLCFHGTTNEDRTVKQGEAFGLSSFEQSYILHQIALQRLIPPIGCWCSTHDAVQLEPESMKTNCVNPDP